MCNDPEIGDVRTDVGMTDGVERKFSFPMNDGWLHQTRRKKITQVIILLLGNFSC